MPATDRPVLIPRQMSSTREEEVFEIRIDGKLVCAKRRGKPGVFLHMETFEQVELRVYHPVPYTRLKASAMPFWILHFA